MKDTKTIRIPSRYKNILDAYEIQTGKTPQEFLCEAINKMLCEQGTEIYKIIQEEKSWKVEEKKITQRVKNRRWSYKKWQDGMKPNLIIRLALLVGTCAGLASSHAGDATRPGQSGSTLDLLCYIANTYYVTGQILDTVNNPSGSASSATS